MLICLTPYSSDYPSCNLGAVYNEAMERLAEDDWACLLDHDACFTTSSWFSVIEELISVVPENSLLTVSTNRVGSEWQLVTGIEPNNHDFKYHRSIGSNLEEQYGLKIEEVTSLSPLSGVVMILSKRTWINMGGFCDGFLGVDTDAHRRIAGIGGKVFLIPGLYVYHWYRADDSATNERVVQLYKGNKNNKITHFDNKPNSVHGTLEDEFIPLTGRFENADIFNEALKICVGESRDRFLLNHFKKQTNQQSISIGECFSLIYNPLHFLKELSKEMNEGNELTLTIDNCASNKTITNLIEGRWANIHSVRFYTKIEIEKLLYRSGFEVIHLDRELDSLNSPLQSAQDNKETEFSTTKFKYSIKKYRVTNYGLTSIIIVTHNQLEFTEKCLQSIWEYTDEPIELIVVDNGSNDGTVEYINSITGIKLIENKENRGFPAGANQGLRVASGENILFLNNDVIVTTGWLRRMLEVLNARPNIGLCGPLSNNVSGEQQIPVDYNSLEDIDNFSWKHAERNVGIVRNTNRLVGFCLFAKRKMLHEIGGFDERFGIGNFEDDDLCLRAVEKGWRCVIACDSFVHHFGHQTFKSMQLPLNDIVLENQKLFREKWANQRNDNQKLEAAFGSKKNSLPKYNSEMGFSIRVPETDFEFGVSLTMIVKNEEHHLPDCLKSVSGVVDEIVIVDTGSTDKTIEIAKQFNAKVIEFPWVDCFATARNIALGNATRSWVLWMDADDRLPVQEIPKFKVLKEQLSQTSNSAFVMRVHCTDRDGSSKTVVDHVRLFRNNPKLKWSYRVHEQILPAIRKMSGEVDFTDISIMHVGYAKLENLPLKRSRDHRLLELQERETPEDTFLLFNLGHSFLEDKNYDLAAKYLESSINNSLPGESHIRKCYALIVQVFWKSNNLNRALELSELGLSECPEDAELLFCKGAILNELGNSFESERCFQKILNLEDKDYFASYDPGILSYKCVYNLACSLKGQVKYEEAIRQLEFCINNWPKFLPAYNLIGELLLSQGKFFALRKIIKKLWDLGMKESALFLEGKLSIALGLFEKGERLFESLISLNENSIESRRFYSHTLIQQGKLERAENELKWVISQPACNIEDIYNLAAVFFELKKVKECSEALKRCTNIDPNFLPAIDLAKKISEIELEAFS